MRKRVLYTVAVALAVAACGLIAYFALREPSNEESVPDPAEKRRIARSAIQDPLYRGKPISHWRHRILNGDFRFSGWSGSL